MDIAALSMASSQLSVRDQASILVLKQAMDTSATQNQDMLSQLSATTSRVSPAHLGNAIDISA